MKATKSCTRNGLRSPRRGRPPLPFEERVSGRILQKLGSRRIIKHRLDFEGETAVDIFREAGVTGTREWASVLMKELGIPLSKRRGHRWRIARFLRRNGKDAKTRKVLVHNLLTQSWMNEQVRAAGSFDTFAEELQLPAHPLRDLLLRAKIRIPRTPAKKVLLKCGWCKEEFLRSAKLEERLKKRRIHGVPCCCIDHSSRYSAERFGFGRKNR